MKKLLALVLVLLAAGAVADITNQPVSIPTGLSAFGPTTVSDSLSNVTARLKRCTAATPTFWCNEATAVRMKLFVSTDGGSSYVQSCGFGASGGTLTNRQGQEIPESWVLCQLPAGTSRRLRAEVAVENGPLVSELTLEAR
jgi:hypothetical protein